ncbi:MAG: hypothetical protein P8M80_12185, partial [Pirellulaceae bacterium]|nr:hypothetical protein [Pirellulaceae bacterium]
MIRSPVLRPSLRSVDEPAELGVQFGVQLGVHNFGRCELGAFVATDWINWGPTIGSISPTPSCGRSGVKYNLVSL